MYNFSNTEEFAVLDYVAVALAVVLLGGYHVVLWGYNRWLPHTSISSHVDYHLINWGRKAFELPMERIAIMQNMRSNLMVVTCYCNVLLAGVATLGREGFKQESMPHTVRAMAPCALFFISFCHYCFFAWSYHHMHFLYLFVDRHELPDLDHAYDPPMHASTISDATQTRAAADTVELRPVDSAGRTEPHGAVLAAAPITVAASASGLYQQCTAGMTTADLQLLNVLHGASLQRRAKFHFRQGYRFMLGGVVFMFWFLSPILLIIAAVFMTVMLAVNDFPFPRKIVLKFRPSSYKEKQTPPSPLSPTRTMPRNEEPLMEEQ